MKISLAILIVLFTGVNCTTQKPVHLAKSNTLRCEAYRFDRADGKSDKIQLTVKSYWCEDNELIKNGVIVVKDENNKIVSRCDINSAGTAIFELEPGHYTISTRLGPVKTPVVMIQAGFYNLIFLVGPGDTTVD
ncbi:MAG: hypothetical protein WKF68_14100 [Daejeonella sp.]